MRKYFLVFVMLGLTGCATTESLEKSYSEINRQDGINRDEAALIAKKWLVEGKYEGDFQVIAPVTVSYEDQWRVTFLYKSVEYYEKVLDVFVDKQSGEVKDDEIRAKGTPTVTKEPWDSFNQDPVTPNTPEEGLLNSL